MATSPSDFIIALFGRKLPAGLSASIWTKADRTSHYITDPTGADQWQGATDAYVAACLTTTTAPNRRLKARDAKGIPGVWLDVDLPGPEDPPGKRPARDLQQAATICNAVLEPTVLVGSGYGLQAWWLLDDDPWVFGSEAEHQQASRITQGWVLLHRQEARRHGVGLDGVGDLARVMRLPGTLNGKGDGTAPVSVLSWDGPRHSMDAIAGLARSVPLPDSTTADVKVNLAAGFPHEKFDALVANLPLFRLTWDHERKDKDCAAWSTSEWELSLVGQAARAGWTDDELSALVVRHRKRYDGPESEKATREKYIADTIAKARNGLVREERAEVKTQALERMAEAGDSSNGHVNGDVVLNHFTTVVGGGVPHAPVFKELIQYGQDPDQARYVLVTESGHEVNVGPYSNLRQPRRLDERIGPSTGFVMETVKDGDEWRGALRALLAVADLREEPDEPVLEWTRRYLNDRLGGEKNKSAAHREPFEEEGYVYVRLDELARYTRQILKQRVGAEADLKPLLRRVGFEEHSVHYTRRNGGRSTAAYWRIAKEELE